MKVKEGPYKHIKNGHTYLVTGNCEIKDPQTREWTAGVLYKREGQNHLYVRTIRDFVERFEEIGMVEDIETCWVCDKPPELIFRECDDKYRYKCSECPERASFSWRSSKADALTKWNKSAKMVRAREVNKLVNWD